MMALGEARRVSEGVYSRAADKKRSRKYGGQRDEGVARSVVTALSVVYLLVGLLGFVVPDMLGLLQHGYTVGDNLIHLLLGILGLVAVFASGRGHTATRRA